MTIPRACPNCAKRLYAPESRLRVCEACGACFAVLDGALVDRTDTFLRVFRLRSLLDGDVEGAVLTDDEILSSAATAARGDRIEREN